MIVKVRNRARENFTIISNDTLRDKRLSFKALGLLVELLSHNDQWTVIKDACERDSDGEKAIASAFKELETHGYAKLHNFGDKLGQRWIVGETPESLTQTLADLQNGGERNERSPRFCRPAHLQNGGEPILQNGGERNSEKQDLTLDDSGTYESAPEGHRILSSKKNNIKNNKERCSSIQVLEDANVESLLVLFPNKGDIQKARSTARTAIRKLTFEFCKQQALKRAQPNQEPQWFFYYLYTDYNDKKPRATTDAAKPADQPKKIVTDEEWQAHEAAMAAKAMEARRARKMAESKQA